MEFRFILDPSKLHSSNGPDGASCGTASICFITFCLLGCEQASSIQQGFTDSLDKVEPLTSNNEESISNIAKEAKTVLESEKEKYQNSFKRRGCISKF